MNESANNHRRRKTIQNNTSQQTNDLAYIRLTISHPARTRNKILKKNSVFGIILELFGEKKQFLGIEIAFSFY